MEDIFLQSLSFGFEDFLQQNNNSSRDEHMTHSLYPNDLNQQEDKRKSQMDIVYLENENRGGFNPKKFQSEEDFIISSPISTPNTPEQRGIPISSPEVSDQNSIHNWGALISLSSVLSGGTSHEPISEASPIYQENIFNYEETQHSGNYQENLKKEDYSNQLPLQSETGTNSELGISSHNQGSVKGSVQSSSYVSPSHPSYDSDSQEDDYKPKKSNIKSSRKENIDFSFNKNEMYHYLIMINYSEAQALIYINQLEAYSQKLQLKMANVKQRSDSDKNFSGILRGKFRTLIINIFGGKAPYNEFKKKVMSRCSYSTVGKTLKAILSKLDENIFNITTPIGDVYNVKTKIEQLRENTDPKSEFSSIALKPILDYLYDLSIDDLIELDRHIAYVYIHDQAGKCYHGKKTWTQTTNWVNEGQSDAVRSFYNFAFDGFMSHKEEWRLFKYEYILNRRNKEKLNIDKSNAYICSFEQTKKDYEKLVDFYSQKKNYHPNN